VYPSVWPDGSRPAQKYIDMNIKDSKIAGEKLIHMVDSEAKISKAFNAKSDNPFGGFPNYFVGKSSS